MSNEENDAVGNGFDGPANLMDVIRRLIKAGNNHDLPSFTACFALEYQSNPLNHPMRAFQGRAQVEKNWAAVFEEMPDFRMELLDLAIHDNRVWIETRWTGTLKDQTPFYWQGVSIFTIAGKEISGGRLYMEPVELSGTGIDETVKQITNQ